MKATTWDTEHLGPLTEEAVRAKHVPPGHFRVSGQTYPHGTAFSGGMRAATCYVLSGACRYAFGDESIEIRGGQVGDLPEGRFQFEVVGEEPARVVVVWELPNDFWQEDVRAVRVTLAGVSMTVPEGWTDVSDDLPAGSPATLAKPDGIGALQFSPAKYRAGALPKIDPHDLEQLLEDFASTRRLPKRPIRHGRGMHPFVAADFRANGEFLRVWYISNGCDLALVTYVALEPDSPKLGDEMHEADEIVRSLDFRTGT